MADMDTAEKLIDEGRFGDAIECLRQLAEAGPLDARGEYFLGLAYGRCGEAEQAIAAYRRCVALEPGVAAAWRAIAALSYQRDDYSSTVGALEQFRALEPYDRTTLGWAIFALAELKRLDEALALVDEFLQVFPYDPSIQPMQAFLFERQKRFLNAILVAGLDADAALPQSINGQVVLNCVNNLGNDALCETYLDVVFPERTEREGDYAYAKSVADLAALKGDLPGAVEWMQRSIRLGNVEPDAALNLALLQLANGEYDKGWLSYRARHTVWKHLLLPNIPEWNGEPLVGKTVIVHSEQGCGDVMQFVRYLPYLRQTGATVIFNSYPDILELLRHDPRAQAGEALALDVIERIDYQTFLMEFPVLLQPRGIMDFPADVPYLFAPPAKVEDWRRRLDGQAGFKVGLVWAGNPQHDNDHNRSAALGDFADLAAVPGIRCFSLQKGPRSADVKTEAGRLQIEDLSDEIRDFSDTAAILDVLDLVICVDTSVAHLAGAMGRPCWVLIPGIGEDWRWRLEPHATPWYPTLRLFKQERNGDWRQLLGKRVLPRLAELILAQGEENAVPNSPAGIELRWLAGEAVSEERLQQWLRQGVDLPEMAGVARHLALRIGDSKPLEALVAAHPDSIEVRAAQAEWLAMSGDVATACDGFAGLGMESLTGDAYVAWANLLLQAGAPREAMAIVEQAIRRQGPSSRLLTLAGHAAYNLQDWDAARQSYEQAIACCPRNHHARMGLSRLLRLKRERYRAADAMQRAMMLCPKDPAYWKEAIQFALDWGAYPFAEHAARWLLAVEDDASRQICLALALTGQNRRDEAKRLIHDLDTASLSDVSDQLTLAYLLSELRMDERAERTLHEMATYFPAIREVHLMFGSWLLARARWREGWKEYVNGLEYEPLPFTEWRGEALAGKSLFVFQDQGHGDLLQFLPLLRLLPEACRITVAVFGDVEEFVRDQLPSLDVVRREKVLNPQGEFDFAVPLMYLPGLLDVDLLHPPLPAPYYRLSHKPDLGGWGGRLANDRAFKVGIIWAGNPRHPNDRNRSTSLEDWLPLAELTGVSLYSLQKDAASNQAYAFPQLQLHNLAVFCDSMHMTAEAIMQLNLVISVDSGVAHLAAGLGKETWILIPDKWTDFRWQLDREDCPWYPSVRLFRRQPDQSWREVLSTVAAAIRSRVAASG